MIEMNTKIVAGKNLNFHLEHFHTLLKQFSENYIEKFICRKNNISIKNVGRFFLYVNGSLHFSSNNKSEYLNNF